MGGTAGFAKSFLVGQKPTEHPEDEPDLEISSLVGLSAPARR